MKERYFTKENIHRQSEKLLSGLDVKGRQSPFRIAIAKSALLVLDMQRYFLEPSSHAFIPAAPAIVPGIRRLIACFLKKKRPVVMTRHLNTADNAGMLKEHWQELIAEGNPLSQIIPELSCPDSIVLNKTQYDAFYNTSLEKILSEQSVGQLLVSGVMTHLCCETTVRSAFVRGFNVFFPIDGTATYNTSFHLATFRNLYHGFTEPVTVSGILRQIE